MLPVNNNKTDTFLTRCLSHMDHRTAAISTIALLAIAAIAYVMKRMVWKTAETPYEKLESAFAKKNYSEQTILRAITCHPPLDFNLPKDLYQKLDINQIKAMSKKLFDYLEKSRGSNTTLLVLTQQSDYGIEQNYYLFAPIRYLMLMGYIQGYGYNHNTQNYKIFFDDSIEQDRLDETKKIVSAYISRKDFIQLADRIAPLEMFGPPRIFENRKKPDWLDPFVHNLKTEIARELYKQIVLRNPKCSIAINIDAVKGSEYQTLEEYDIRLILDELVKTQVVSAWGYMPKWSGNFSFFVHLDKNDKFQDHHIPANTHEPMQWRAYSETEGKVVELSRTDPYFSPPEKPSTF